MFTILHNITQLLRTKAPFEMTDRHLTIFHFNDVYNVEAQSREPKGGAARFTYLLKQRIAAVQSDRSLVLFSGDAISPSLISGITKGEHIVEALNLMKIDAAVIGNHDFDFGVENLIDCAEKSNFPWLNTNCFDTVTGKPLGFRPQQVIIEKAGLKIGLIGLVEPEWVVTLSTVDQNDVEVLDFVAVGNKWAKKLKQEDHCDIVIALTHMRWPNDVKLAENAVDIDLVLGGHDHDFDVKKTSSGVYAIKSGADFRDLNELQITINAKNKIVNLTSEHHKITGCIPEDEIVKDLVLRYTGELEERMKKEIGQIDVELDLRFDKIRTQETNAGNFVCDIALTAVEADMALISAGTLRTDAIVPAGSYTLKDLNLMLPFLTPLVVIEASGEKVLALLENSVSQYPKMEGRFLQVSGVTFEFQSSKPAFSRVSNVKIQGEDLIREKNYKIATTNFVLEGNDGFTAAKGCKVILNDDDGPQLMAAVRNYFSTISVVRGFRKLRQKTHCQHAISKKLWNENAPYHKHLTSGGVTTPTAFNPWKKVRSHFFEKEIQEASKIAPKIEGRIVMLP